MLSDHTLNTPIQDLSELHGVEPRDLYRSQSSDEKNGHGLYEINSSDAWHRYSTLRK